MGKTAKKIVITGGPGTGKTSLIQFLEKSGHTCFPEIIRTFTEAAKSEAGSKEITTNPLGFVNDPKAFNERLLQGRKQQYLLSRNQNADRVFFDRGIPDILAYMDFFNQQYGMEFIAACKEMRYDAIILLPPWKDIYRSDGERFESYEEALAIHELLVDTYMRYGYDPIHVPTGPVPDRVSYILENL